MKALAATLLLAACTVAEAPAQAQRPAQIIEPVQRPGAPGADSAAPRELSLSCAGDFTQGGVVLCRTLPGARIFLDGAEAGEADARGWAVIGFTRDHPVAAQVAASDAAGRVAVAYEIAPREFDVQRVDGLPQQTVTPTDPAVLARIQREVSVKQRGFASSASIEGFLDGFIWPVDGRISGRWGNQRVLNGVPATPHFGVDIAAPEGASIRAPAAGVVTLAEPDMHYEGGLVFIDHGQGLITMYLHMSRLDVAVGQSVAQGDVIGAVGSRGRATGPHLCWRMRWRERQLDPSLAIDGLRRARMQLAANQAR